MSGPKPLRDADWLAARLGLRSKYAAYELIRTGAVPSVRINRIVRVDEDVVEAWIAAGGTASNGESAA